MKNLSSKPYPLLPLTPAVFHVLLALSRGDQYGYRIMQMVEEDAHGFVPMRSILSNEAGLVGSVPAMYSARLFMPSPSGSADGPASGAVHKEKYRR